MSPLRAFLLSFAAGLAILFSGQGLVSAANPPSPTGTITV
jgi:hypothetical protein